MDQALFAGANFVLNILLIDAVSDTDYSAYAVAFSIFLFFGTVHTGILTEPMLVFGAGRFKGRFRDYFSILRRGHAMFSMGAFATLLLLGVGANAAGRAELSQALFAAACAQPFILFLWLARRACYVHLKPRWSAAGGVIYAVVLLGGVIATSRYATLTVPMMFGIMAGGSLVGALWIQHLLARKVRDQEEHMTARTVADEHRRYGAWAVATGVLAWLPSNIPFIVLEFFGERADPGILKAVLNFIMPAAHAYAALSILLVPIFVRARESGRFSSFVATTAGMLAVVNTLYWLMLGLFGPELVQLLYRGNYLEYAPLLWLAGVYPIISGVAVVVRTALRSLERPNHVFWASLASSISAITLTVFLIARFGVPGAIIGISVNIALELAVMFTLFRSGEGSPNLATVAPAGSDS